MLKDRQFKLKTATIGILSVDGHQTLVTVPTGAIIDVVSDTYNDSLVDVLWEGKHLMMFVQDVAERGDEITAG